MTSSLPQAAAPTTNTHKHTDPQQCLTDALATTARLWPDLDEVHLASTLGTHEHGWRLPGGDARTTLAIDTPLDLAYWTRTVLDGRSLPGVRVDAADVPATCEWLSRHAGWLAERIGIPDVVAIERLANRARALLEPTGVRTIVVGDCPAIECPGVVTATLDPKKEDQGLDLVCNVDEHHVWPPSKHGILARAIGQDAPERMSAQDLAAYLTAAYKRTVTRQTVARWCQHHPITVRAGEDGLFDRVRVTEWYLGWRAARATRAA